MSGSSARNGRRKFMRPLHNKNLREWILESSRISFKRSPKFTSAKPCQISMTFKFDIVGLKSFGLILFQFVSISVKYTMSTLSCTWNYSVIAQKASLCHKRTCTSRLFYQITQTELQENTDFEFPTEVGLLCSKAPVTGQCTGTRQHG
jgi:hypothetical protein